MAHIKAFKGIRPRPEYIEDVVSRPYDVVNYDEAKQDAKLRPYSFTHVVRSEVDFDEIDPYDSKVYEKAKENLDSLINNKIMFQDQKDSLYIYAQTMDNRTQYGLVFAIHVKDYVDNIIKRHENTRKQKEDDRYMHVKTTKANTGPVFLTYNDRNTIDSLVENYIKTHSPVYDFTFDNVRHTFWVLNNDNDINKLLKEFSEIDSLYVADGHHRSASAARVALDMAKENKNHTGNEEYNYFLAVAFPASQLHIMPYNRLLNVPIDRDLFLNKIEEHFSVEKVSYDTPKQKGEILTYLDGSWYSLKLKDNSKLGIVDSLDVAILQNFILEPIFGIDDPRTDSRISFVGGIKGIKPLQDAVDSKKATVAFSMYPTGIDELMAVSDANLLMPPKSTWFEPKLLSGLIVHKIQD